MKHNPEFTLFMSAYYMGSGLALIAAHSVKEADDTLRADPRVTAGYDGWSVPEPVPGTTVDCEVPRVIQLGNNGPAEFTWSKRPRPWAVAETEEVAVRQS